MNAFGVNNKQPYNASPGGLGSLLGMGGLGSTMGMGGMGGYPGLPSGYAAPPAGVPFNQNPYLSFGSGFGLGLPFWASGFGRGPQYPDNLWTPPSQENSPQTPVTPPGGGGADQGGGAALDLLRFNQTGQLPGGGQGMTKPGINPAYNQSVLFQGAPGGFQQQFQDVYGANAVPQFAQNSYQQWLDNQG